MKYLVVCFFDREMGIYSQPQFDNHTPEVLTEMYATGYQKGMLKEERGIKWSSLELVKLGEYDDKTGLIAPLSKPETLLVFSTLKVKESQDGTSTTN